MKKIMFSDMYGLTRATLLGYKNKTRRIIPEGTPLGSWEETENKSKYKVGEVVAVAQRYSELSWDQDFYEKLCATCKGLPQHVLAGWDNKMFVRADLMPNQIKFTDVVAERLQDISDEDCLAEGIRKWTKDGELFKYDLSDGFEMFDWQHKPRTPREAYAALIDKISGKGTWASNPYVFAYTFELVK